MSGYPVMWIKELLSIMTERYFLQRLLSPGFCSILSVLATQQKQERKKNTSKVLQGKESSGKFYIA